MWLGSRSTVRDGGGDREVGGPGNGLLRGEPRGAQVGGGLADNLLCTGNKLLLLHVLKDPDNETPTNRRFQGFQEHCGKLQMNTDARSNKVVSITVLATHALTRFACALFSLLVPPTRDTNGTKDEIPYVPRTAPALELADIDIAMVITGT
ncbi:hypothetical protein ACQ4PT_031553 [Festuca glaucescens]